MRSVVVFFVSMSSLCIGGRDWCDLPCDNGEKHTMCIYKPHTAIKGCKNIADSQTPSGRKGVLHLHNKYRDDIASGNMQGWPKAANMRQMSWDSEIEEIALRWAQQCVAGHDKCRRTVTFGAVGQNYGMEGSSAEYPSSNGSFEGWVGEIKLIKDVQAMLKSFQGGSWGHFTQVIWAASYKLGCGEIHTDEAPYKKTILICNYGPAGNMVEAAVYEQGEPCSNCPTGTRCREDSLYPHLCSFESDPIAPIDIEATTVVPVSVGNAVLRSVSDGNAEEGHHAEQITDGSKGPQGERRGSPKRMDRLRRSFRDSFRRRKEHVPESSKPHLWQADESSVRAGTCTFHVKYLGCVEVYESRGMNVCEEALKVLRNSRRRPVKAVLFVSGDGLRVVEDETKGLIVDQTIEKVSFCAPDRNHDKGFSYICRDGTTRRWMCHGFLALKESGERLSHAVGCAFAACLERKQRREKECGVTMSFDPASSTFTRQGSFRAQTITERLASDNNNKTNITVPTTEAPPIPTAKPVTTSSNIISSTKPPLPTHAIERPHATVSMLVRQGSFRGFNHLNQASPFKRQLSLRITDLPSNLERTRSMSLEGGNDSRQPQAPPLIHLKTPVSPIPETSPLADKTDPVSAMCQQLSQGLQLLTNADNDILSSSTFSNNNTTKNHNIFGTDDLKSSMTKDILSNEFNSKIDAVSFNLSNLENSGTGRSVLTPPATPPLATELPRPDQWLGKVAEVAGSGGRPPPLAHLRAQSLDTSAFSRTDPFDAEWVPPPLSAQRSTNPFLNSSASTPVKAFEVQM